MDRIPIAAALAFALASASGAVVGGNGERIANEGSIGDHWMLAPGTTLPVPVYPPHLAARGLDACVALGYRINPDGSTSDFRVVKQWNSESGASEPVDGFWSALAEAGADAVSRWRFQARPGITPEPTYTVATLGFEAGRDPDSATVNAHCRVADLAARLDEIDGRVPLHREVQQGLEQLHVAQRVANGHETSHMAKRSPHKQ